MKKISFKIRLFMLALAFIFAVYPLGVFADNSPYDSAPSAVREPITKIGFPKTVLPIQAGKRFTIIPSIYPSDSDEVVIWNSSDDFVVSVSQSGSVYAKKTGKATITAFTEYGNKSARCVFTVQKTPVNVTALSVPKKKMTIYVGQTVAANAIVMPITGVITYSSSKKAVASVSASGNITAKAPGKAVITLKAGKKTQKINVTVKKAIPIKSIAFKKLPSEIIAGQSYMLKLAVFPSNATVTGVSWVSSSKKVATISSAGEMKAIKAGRVTITAKVNGNKTVKTLLTVLPNGPVYDVYVSGVTLNKTSAELGVGSSLRLTPTVHPSNADNKNVSWISGSADVAIVDNGVVIALAPGNAVITAVTEDGRFEAACNIKAVWIPPSLVTISNTHETMRIGEKLTLRGTVFPINASDKSVSWSSESPEIASVDSNGVVTAHSPGRTDIVVTANEGGARAYC